MRAQAQAMHDVFPPAFGVSGWERVDPVADRIKSVLRRLELAGERRANFVRMGAALVFVMAVIPGWPVNTVATSSVYLGACLAWLVMSIVLHVCLHALAQPRAWLKYATVTADMAVIWGLALGSALNHSLAEYMAMGPLAMVLWICIAGLRMSWLAVAWCALLCLVSQVAIVGAAVLWGDLVFEAGSGVGQAINLVEQGVVLMLIGGAATVIGSSVHLARQVAAYAVHAGDANPLTSLPGNRSIHAHLQQALRSADEVVAVYADLDHFKVFNDYAGFEAGDEVIKLAGRCLLDACAVDSASFVGHIGGDDFVAVVRAEVAHDVSMRAAKDFRRGVLAFYSHTDQERGFVEVRTRRGDVRTYPLCRMTLAGVPLPGQYRHLSDLATACAEMKRVAKGISEDGLIMDRRGRRPASPISGDPVSFGMTTASECVAMGFGDGN
jgi:diguanylate cyclase (GGDEF)-like protein